MILKCQFISNYFHSLTIKQTMNKLNNINFFNKKVIQYLKKLSIQKENELIQTLYHKQKENPITYDMKQWLKNLIKQVKFLGYDSDYCMIFGIYGPLIDQNKLKDLFTTLMFIIQQCFYLPLYKGFMVKEFKKQSTEGITLVYFNKCFSKKGKMFTTNQSHKNQSIQSITSNQFKNDVIKKLPIKYLQKLNKIYILYQNHCIFYKSLDFFSSLGFQGGFYDQYFYQISSIYELFNNLGPLFTVDRIQSQSIRPSQNPISWMNIFTEDQLKKAHKQFNKYQNFCKSLISTPNLPSQQHKYKKNIESYRLNNNFPLILEVLYEQIITKYLNHQGLFRLVAYEKELEEFQNRIFQMQNSSKNFNNQQYQNLLKSSFKTFTPQTIASFIKKFFAELNDPYPNQLEHIQYNNLSEQNIQNSGQLKSVKYITFKKTIKLLATVKDNQKWNKMSSKNLAICFSPCFLRTSSNHLHNQHQAISYQINQNYKFIDILTKMIQNQILIP